jgi:cyclin-dependent kinase 12/13
MIPNELLGNHFMLTLFPNFSRKSIFFMQFFFTSPLACDLSGLPTIYKEDDENIQAKEQIK